MMFDTRLPQPNDSFRWVQVGSRPALVCRALEPLAAHVFTTRGWDLGVSTGGDEPRSWAEVAAAMAVHPDGLVRVRQVHGANVVVRRVGDTLADYATS